MENYLTSGDLALYENRRGYGYDDYYRRHGHSAAATTGIGLAAGLGGGALLLAIAGIWGINKASEARTRGVENLSAANAETLKLVAGAMAQERQRSNGVEIDVQQTLRSLTGATAQGGSATSQALATAEALALLNNNGNSALNSAIGGCNFLRVARYSAPQPCPCDTCCNS